MYYQAAINLTELDNTRNYQRRHEFTSAMKTTISLSRGIINVHSQNTQAGLYKNEITERVVQLMPSVRLQPSPENMSLKPAKRVLRYRLE